MKTSSSSLSSPSSRTEAPNWAGAAITHWPHFIGTSRHSGTGTIKEFKSERTWNVKWSLSRLKSKIQRRTQTMGPGTSPKLYIPNTINTWLVHWHMKCNPCALVYFDTRKCTLKPKLTVFSMTFSCGHYNALHCMYRKSNFVLVLAHKNIKNPDCPIS